MLLIKRHLLRAVCCWAILMTSPLSAAEFIFINGDGPNEGLNDPTVVAPVGGNTATTLGGQRLAALQRVGEIWGSFLVSAVPIRVFVQFDVLEEGTLAGASAISLQENFTKAPKPNCWYPIALANSIAGKDLEPTVNDIEVIANSNGTFYYGLDSASPGEQSNFVDVLLHELGHGLGFISFVDPSNGSFYSNHVDVFTSLMVDEQFNSPWASLTASQRRISALNEPYLVFNGPYTNAGLQSKLVKQPGTFGFRLTTKTGNANSILTSFKQAAFGPQTLFATLNAPLALTDTSQSSPADRRGACIPLTNASAVAGKIALVRRGICDFDTKVYHAQLAGAVAVIIVNNVSSPSTIFPGGDSLVDGVPVSITIPSVMVSKTDGDKLISAASTSQATFTPLLNDHVATTSNRLRLYAPETLSDGSSVSHWSTEAEPDLLMEPFINPSLDRQLDLTLTQMKDIGWQVVDIPFPYLTYTTWKSSVFAAADTLTNPTDDPDRDGVSNLEEYFFGNLPKTSDAEKLPVFRLTEGMKQFVFNRSKLSTDLVYQLEKSSDLVSFVPAVEGVDYAITAVRSVNNEVEEITMNALNPPAVLFLRLRIVGN